MKGFYAKTELDTLVIVNPAHIALIFPIENGACKIQMQSGKILETPHDESKLCEFMGIECPNLM